MDRDVFELNDLALCGALDVIKRYCRSELFCADCQLYGDNGCRIAEPDILPYNWEIKYVGDR